MLELRTFGALELRTATGGTVGALSGRTKCLAVLAYLATTGTDRRVPRDELAPLLWSEGTDEQARNSLRVALSHIRQSVDHDLVLGEGASNLALDSRRVRADVAAFCDAVASGDHARVLELHRGDFLAGVRVPGARGFQRWADERRGRFRHEAYESALAIGRSALEAGELATAEEGFRTALDLGPLREEAAAGLVRVLADRDRTADAIRLFEGFRERRREELDLGPSEELEELVEGLRAGRAGTDRESPGRSAGGASPEGETAGSGAVGGAGKSGRATRARDAERSAAPDRRRREERTARRPVIAGLAALALLAAGIAGGWYLLGFGGESPSPVRERSVAVLPFGPVGSDDPAPPIAGGLHASLLTRLSAVSDLDVVAASASDRFRDSRLPLSAVADSLGVRWLVEGDVQQAGDEIRVNAQLVDPRSGIQAWAATYRRRLTADNLFRIEAELAEAIARSLEARLAPGEERLVRHRPTGDLEAYRLYLEGRRLLGQRTEEKMRRAVDLFRRALERDSSLALAWAGLADAAIIVPSWGHELPDGMPEAEAAARRALSLDPDLAEAHVALAKVEGSRKGDYAAALLHLRRAVELRPSFAPAHSHLALTLLQTGSPEEALRSFERTAEVDPYARLLPGAFAQIHLASGNYEEALRWAQRSPELEAPFPVWNLEAWTLYHLGRLEEAEALLADAEGSANRAVLALVRVAAGDSARARGILRELESAPEDQFWAGLVRAGLGDVDGAFEAFDRIARWDPMEIRTLRYHFPDVLGPVRRDPRHEALLGEVNRQLGLNPDGSVPDSTVTRLGLPKGS